MIRNIISRNLLDGGEASITQCTFTADENCSAGEGLMITCEGNYNAGFRFCPGATDENYNFGEY